MNAGYEGKHRGLANYEPFSAYYETEPPAGTYEGRHRGTESGQ